jgi:acetyltransferase-like isoleucine patch superfamily enzyme
LRPGSHIYWRLRRRRPLARARYRLRRRLILVRLRLDAAWVRSHVEATIAPDAAFGPGVRVVVAPGTRSVLRVGAGGRIGAGVRIRLEGGQALIGDRVDIRRHSSLVVGGRLEMGDRILVQPGCSLHCADAVVVRSLAVLSEYATVVDSSHHYTGPDDWVLDNVHTAPVEIGYNAWIGAKATVGRGVRIGDHAVVAANSLVTRDVPSGHLASGVPAEVRRPLDLPWRPG